MKLVLCYTCVSQTDIEVFLCPLNFGLVNMRPFVDASSPVNWVQGMIEVIFYQILSSIWRQILRLCMLTWSWSHGYAAICRCTRLNRPVRGITTTLLRLSDKALNNTLEKVKYASNEHRGWEDHSHLTSGIFSLIVQVGCQKRLYRRMHARVNIKLRRLATKQNRRE